MVLLTLFQYDEHNDTPGSLYGNVWHYLLLFPVTSLFFFGLRDGAVISNITHVTISRI